VKIAITGATGSLGGALIELLRERWPVTRLVALSRDEVKGGDLAERYADYAPLKCQLADVRDEQRLEEVFRGCDVVVHAAALKRIGHSVYSPEEIVKTNVQGTINVVRAATAVGVGRVLVVSSDKACEATNLYGMSKAVAECYAVQSNTYAQPRGTRVACVRYGNVLGSRGSVVHVWRDQLRRGEPLAITDPLMTRFIITLSQAARFVMRSLERMEGGEVFVPLLPAASMSALADAVERDWRTRIAQQEFAGLMRAGPRIVVGLRPGGEKLHEALLSREEPSRTYLLDGYTNDFAEAVIYPAHHSWREAWDHPTSVRRTAAYTSDAPHRWLDVAELVRMVREV